MVRFATLLLSALSAWKIVAQGTPSCISPCVEELKAQFARERRCDSAANATCLCPIADFSYGIRDCGRSCGANDANVRQLLASSFCAGILHDLSASSATTPSSTAQSGTGGAQSTDAVQSSVSSIRQSISSATVTSSSSAVSATTDSSVTPAATETPTPSSTDANSSNTASSTSDGVPLVSSASATSSPSGGLSGASAAGVGIGVGAAVIALAGVGICFFLRNRKQSTRKSVDISKPLPGSGKTYPPSRGQGSMEKYGNEIEMTSNRYEDMVPRQQPRTMV